jgi:hypothetical protein
LAKQNEDGTDVRATVGMVLCFTEQNVDTHTAESILTTGVADSMVYRSILHKEENTSKLVVKIVVRF